MLEGDELIMSTSNGGMIIISSSLMDEKAYDGQEFDANITGVPLASSLRIRIEQVCDRTPSQPPILII